MRMRDKYDFKIYIWISVSFYSKCGLSAFELSMRSVSISAQLDFRTHFYGLATTKNPQHKSYLKNTEKLKSIWNFMLFFRLDFRQHSTQCHLET